MQRKLKSLIALPLVVVFVEIPSPSQAADPFYQGADGDWTVITDWSGGAQPTSADRANVNGGLTVNVTTDVGTINALRVGTAGNGTDGTGTLIIDGTSGGALVIEDSGGTGVDVIIGSGAFTGTLQLINGGVLTSNNLGGDGQVYIGQGNGSDGILLLDSGTLNANRGLYVADGTGAGGTATIGDGVGVGDAILNTQGANLEVGNDGNGTLTVLADGIVNVNSNNLVIGQTGASNGHLIVEGGLIDFATTTTADINMNSGASQLTINSGTITAVRNINQSLREGTPSTMNLNGGFISTTGDIVDRNGLSTINYNGTQLAIGGNDLSATTMNVGTAAAGGPVIMNLVGSGLSTGQGEVEANSVIVYRGLNLGTDVDATVNVNNGFLEVRRGIAGGAGISTLNVGTSPGLAGELRIEGVNGAVDVSSQITSLNVGADGTLTARPNFFTLNPIQTAAADLTGGTLAIDQGLITAAASNNQNFETIWVGGSTEWDGTAALWSRGQPAGYTIAANTEMTVVDSATPITGTVGFATAGWTLVDDGTTSGQLVVSNDALIDAGPVRAVLRGTPSADAVVTRSSDLIISNSNSGGAIGLPDAAHLEILDNARLEVTGNVYVGGANQGTVDQNGSMSIDGHLYFGQDPAGGDDGGTWNLNGGETLTVTGSIEERDQSTNSAQFYIRGGTLDVAGDITVQRLDLAAGNNQNSTLNLKPGQTVTSTGTTQIGANSTGRINVTDSTSVLQAANMRIGAGNSNDSTLNVTAGIGGTNGGDLTLGANAGTNSGPRILVSGTGIVRVSDPGGVNAGDITIPATGAADLDVNSGRTININVTDSGLLDIARHFNLHNSTATNGGVHQLTVQLDDTATIAVGQDINYRAGTSTINVQGGTLTVGRDLLMNEGTGTFTVAGTPDAPATVDVTGDLLINGGTQIFRVEGSNDTITIGNNITQAVGQTFSFAPDAAGLSVIDASAGIGFVTLDGNLEVDTALLTSEAASVEALTTWNTGSGTWATTDAEWQTTGGRMVNPDGVAALDTGDRITAFKGFFLGTPTVTTADWAFDAATDPSKGDLVYSGVAIDSLPLHAVLDATANGSPLTIDRTTDLVIAPVAGNAASELTVNSDVTLSISDGTLDGTGPNLILGGAAEYGDVTQNGGTVSIDGILGFGAGAGTLGGTFTLNDGTLNVYGDIVEGGVGGVDTGVDTAQLYINGGDLNVTGTNIDVQSFRTGQSITSDATVTLADKVVSSSGEFHVGDEGKGVLNVTGTTDITAGTWLYLGTSSTGDGTLNLGDGTDSPIITVGSNDLVIGQSGYGEMNFLSGTVNSTSGLHLGNQTDGVGSLTVGDGTTTPVINNSGGNFETANAGTGIVTWNSGTLNQTSNNLIVGQGSSSNATFILNGGLIDIDNMLRMNNGTGLFVQDGGVVNVGTTLDMENGNVATNDMTYQISAGTLNVGDRATGDLVIGNTSNADSVAQFDHSGGTVNVNRHVYAGSGATGDLTFNNAADTLNIGYDYTGMAVTNGSARLFVADSATADGSSANLVEGSVNIGGGIWVGSGGGEGTVTVGFAGGIDADTTIRVGMAGSDGGAETRVGNSGTGTLTLESGTYFQETQNFVVANSAGATGSVVIDGGELNVGFDQPTSTNNGVSDLVFGGGTGTLTQNDGIVRIANRLVFNTTGGEGTYNAAGGVTEVSGDIVLAPDPAGRAALNVSGGTVNVGGNIDYGANLGDDSISLTSGTLNFAQSGGGTIDVRSARDGFTFSGGTLQNLGTFNGYDPATAPEVANLGSNPSDAFLINGLESGFAAGKVGNAVAFDGNMGNNEAVSFYDDRFGNPEALSVSVWFNRSQDNGTNTNHGVNNVLVAQSSASANDNFEIGTQGSNLELYLDTNGPGALNPTGDFLSIDLSGVGSGIVDNQWHHVVLTYDGNAASDRLNVFFDGQEVTSFDKDAFSGVLQGASGATDSPFSLGIARPGDNNWGDFSGQLDEFAAWNSAISAADVADLYNTGNGSNTAAILGTANIYAPLEQQLVGNLETFTQTGGTFAPGLATGGAALMAGSTIINADYELSAGIWSMDLSSNGGILNDFIDVNGTLTLGGGSMLDLNLIDFATLMPNDVFVIGEYDVLSGAFGSVNFADLEAQLSGWQIDYNYGGGNQIAILVPEPSRMMLLGLGLGLLCLRRRRGSC